MVSVTELVVIMLNDRCVLISLVSLAVSAGIPDWYEYTDTEDLYEYAGELSGNMSSNSEQLYLNMSV